MEYDDEEGQTSNTIIGIGWILILIWFIFMGLSMYNNTHTNPSPTPNGCEIKK